MQLTNLEIQNFWWTLEFLSDIELYYTDPSLVKSNFIEIHGEESKHILKVMRHLPGDTLYVTNGLGSIFKGEISSIENNIIVLNIVKQFKYSNKFSNITFCLPKLKNHDRLEFALEKCVEMGITNFIIFESSRCISKGEKTERWKKILLSAMKQSLRSYLPVIKEISTLLKLTSKISEMIIFDQNSDKRFKDIIFNPDQHYYLIFGPEGGLSKEELSLFNDENIYNLSENRLRSETAIIKAAALL